MDILLKDKDGVEKSYKDIRNLRFKDFSGNFRDFPELYDLIYCSEKEPENTSRLWVKTSEDFPTKFVSSYSPMEYFYDSSKTKKSSEQFFADNDFFSNSASVIAGNKIYVFGGRKDDGTLIDTIYEIDTTTLEINLRTEKLPETRELARAYYDDKTNKIYLFGGETANGKVSQDIISVALGDTLTIGKLSATLINTETSNTAICGKDRSVYIYSEHNANQFNLDTQTNQEIDDGIYNDLYDNIIFLDQNNNLILAGGDWGGWGLNTTPFVKNLSTHKVEASIAPNGAIYAHTSDGYFVQALQYSQTDGGLYIGKYETVDNEAKVNYSFIVGGVNEVYQNLGPNGFKPLLAKGDNGNLILYSVSQDNYIYKMTLNPQGRFADLMAESRALIVVTRDFASPQYLWGTELLKNTFFYLAPYDAFIYDTTNNTCERIKIAKFNQNTSSWEELN